MSKTLPGIPIVPTAGSKTPTIQKILDAFKPKDVKKRPIPFMEQIKISSMLENYHAVFYTFFEMSSMWFSNEIPTACVQFFKVGRPQMLINEDFWNSLNALERPFVVCHECLHVLLDHGIRNGKEVKGATPALVNIAQDITINEMIVSLFKYDRNDLRDWKKLCWIETCFKDPIFIKRDETFTYYLEQLVENASDAVKNGLVMTFDVHGEPDDGHSSSGGKNDPLESGSKEEQAAREKLAKAIAETLSADDLAKIVDALPEPGEPVEGSKAGTMKGNYEFLINRREKPLKLKIHRLIKKLKRTRFVKEEIDIETFVKMDRRFAQLARRSDVKLPGSVESEKKIQDRLLVALYMDISGSCVEHAPVFKQILQAFKLEEREIETIPYVFDTSVTKITYNTPIHVGGGTAFDIIEDENQLLAQKIGRYPDCVIVVTDGEGTPVTPQHPKRWIWLMTDRHSKTYVDPRSKLFSVKEVTFQ